MAAKIKVRCPECSKLLKGATDEMIGDVGVCPKCKAEFEIKQDMGEIPQARKRLLVPVALGLALLIGLAVILAQNNGPKATVKKFFSTLNAGDAETAGALLIKYDEPPITKQAMAALLRDSRNGDTTKLEAACSAAVEKGGYKVKVLDVNIEGETATVKVRLNFNWVHPPWETELKLTKQSGQWLIRGPSYTLVMTGMSLRLYGDMDTRVVVGLPTDYSF